MAVTITGYPTTSAHAPDAFVRLVRDAVDHVARVWNWHPETVTIGFHDSEKVLGKAFRPGRSAGVRRITLGRPLLRDYDLKAIRRTLLHELAHHYREERLPRPAGGKRAPHDPEFCRALGQVDPLVRGHARCGTSDDQGTSAGKTLELERVFRRGKGTLVVDYDARRVYRRGDPRGGIRMPIKPHLFAGLSQLARNTPVVVVSRGQTGTFSSSALGFRPVTEIVGGTAKYARVYHRVAREAMRAGHVAVVPKEKPWPRNSKRSPASTRPSRRAPTRRRKPAKPRRRR